MFCKRRKPVTLDISAAKTICNEFVEYVLVFPIHGVMDKSAGFVVIHMVESLAERRSIASGWSHVGLYSETSLNLSISVPSLSFYKSILSQKSILVNKVFTPYKRIKPPVSGRFIKALINGGMWGFQSLYR